MESLDDILYVHAGTQTGSILGFQGTLTSLQNFYAYSPNLGSVKCINSNGRFLITGGFDEIIRLYDLKQKKEKGQLLGHEGTITCIQSFQNMIISGAEDSVIIIWKSKEWSLLFRLKGHKDSVHDIAIHPTGKILASVGKDRKIILWNLINGTKIFRKTMPFNVYKIKWAPEENVVVMGDNSIHLISQENNLSIKEWKHPKRVNDFIIIDDIIVVAGDEGNLYFWNNCFNVEEPSYYLTFLAHTPRVKKIKYLKVAEVDYLVTCSTDGTISTWEIAGLLPIIKDLKENKTLDDIKPYYSLNSYQRIITMDVHFASQVFQNDPVVHTAADEEGEELELEEEKETRVNNNNNNKNKKKEQNKGVVKAEKQGKKIKKVSFVEQVPKNNPKKKQTLIKQQMQQKKLNNVPPKPAHNVPRKKNKNRD